ncbi:MAG: hypothetical protein LKI39_15310 [Bacteroides sp.]|jgi:hypothetical protein|nr:hypothetical protein [Bacteroides sp.]
MKSTSLKAKEQGYIILPKTYLKKYFNTKIFRHGQLEDILKIILHVNYSDTVYTIKQKEILCHRGEAVRSYAQWGTFFGWTRQRTTRFINKLQQAGVIKILSTNKDLLHIRVIDYDVWMGREFIPKQPGQEQTEQTFREFWEKYHDTLCVKRRNIGRAQTEWMKLSEKDRQLATESIENFYYSIEDTRFIPQASTYLADKAFLNDFSY